MLAICAAAMGIVACSPSQEQIKQQVDSAMKINADIDSAYQALVFSFETYKPQLMDAALDGLRQYMNDAKARLQKAKLPSGELKAALGAKIDIMESLSQNECAEQVRLYKISEVEFTESNRNEWDEYAKSAEKKLSEANKNVTKSFNNISKKQTI